MTDYEFRAAVQAAFGGETVMSGFWEKLFGRLRDANIHIGSIHHTASATPGSLEISARMQDAGGAFERRIRIAKDLGVSRMQDIRPPSAAPPEEGGRREPPPDWTLD